MSSDLVLALTLGDVFGADLDLGRHQTLEHIRAVETQQVGNLLSLCTVEAHMRELNVSNIKMSKTISMK